MGEVSRFQRRARLWIELFHLDIAEEDSSCCSFVDLETEEAWLYGVREIVRCRNPVDPSEDPLALSLDSEAIPFIRFLCGSSLGVPIEP